MHVTATLTEMGELVDIQTDDLGRQVKVIVNITVKACQCCIKPWRNIQESLDMVPHIFLTLILYGRE
jgi:metal-sulfur cluster biosynthetic enzyme